MGIKLEEPVWFSLLNITVVLIGMVFAFTGIIGAILISEDLIIYALIGYFIYLGLLGFYVLIYLLSKILEA